MAQSARHPWHVTTGCWKDMLAHAGFLMCPSPATSHCIGSGNCYSGHSAQLLLLNRHNAAIIKARGLAEITESLDASDVKSTASPKWTFCGNRPHR